MEKITVKNIKNFLQGNFDYLVKDQLFNVLPTHTKEQIMYRESYCSNECRTTKKCQYCGCAYPAKLYNDVSCNKGKELPKLMSEIEWEWYKTNVIFKDGINKH